MKKLLFRLLLLLFGFGLSGCNQIDKEPLTIQSPNGIIKLAMSLEESGQAFYTVSFKGEELISPSPLGFETDNYSIDLTQGFTISSSNKKEHYSEWESVWGENKHHINHYNELTVHLNNEDSVDLKLCFRLFNEGLAFRYEYDIKNHEQLTLVDEYTSFNFVERQTSSWTIPADFESYEHLYRTVPLANLEEANTPATIEFKDLGFAVIHEAALVDFPEMTLKAIAPYKFKANLAPLPDKTLAVVNGRFKTPWRTIHLVEKAIDLIGSSLLLNLNEPSVIEDTEWIKPMKYIGVWWGMHLGIETWKMGPHHGATTENAIAYIDFAHENNIDAVLFEGWNRGWETWGINQEFNYTTPYPDFDIDKITAYAKMKKVAIIGHHETGGNIPFYEAQLDSALEWYASKGVTNLKTGYAGAFKEGYKHHSQYGVQHYRRVVEKAAQLGITINAHEPIKDTGLSRTYPNSMTREGGRGMEWNAWSSGNPPEHQTILPFTRLVSGPMDYTPGIFDILFENSMSQPHRKKWNDQDQGDSRVNTTLAKQIALWVTIYSPLQMAADLISNYQDHPAFQFFRDFDPDYDATYPLAGEPGEYVAIARKAKEKFFLGAITNRQKRELTVKLDFLKAKQNYEAIIYADGDSAHWKTNPTEYTISKRVVKKSSELNLNLAPGGGVAISFIPI